MSDKHEQLTPEPLDRWRERVRSEFLRICSNGGDIAASLDKTLVSLSAGALVFSMTFVGTLAPERLWLPLLSHRGRLSAHR